MRKERTRGKKVQASKKLGDWPPCKGAPPCIGLKSHVTDKTILEGKSGVCLPATGQCVQRRQAMSTMCDSTIHTYSMSPFYI